MAKKNPTNDERTLAYLRRVGDIVNDISDKIRDGSLKPGDQLPTTAEMIEYHNGNVRVVQAARNRLKKMGLVESRGDVGRRGLYTFVTPTALEKLK